MNEKITRIEMEHADGRIQRLTGSEANRWLREVDTVVMMNQMRYATSPPFLDFKWEWTSRDVEQSPFRDYPGTD